MASYTENYNLKKPDRTDFYSVQDFNDNADIIDTALNDKLNKDFSNVSSGAVPIANGGTGATTAANALSNLGVTTALNNKADKDLSNVTVTLPITKGGTGATTAANALSNIGVTTALNNKVDKDLSNVTGTLPITKGGTGATTAADALSNLGITTALNNKVDKDLSNVTGTLPIAKGGTGATTAANALSNLGAVPLGGGVMTGKLEIEYNYTDEASFTVTNPNGSVQLSVNNSRGIYDKGNSKWVLQSSSGSSDWTFNGTATNAQKINNQTVNLVYTQSSQPSSAANGSLWAW